MPDYAAAMTAEDPAAQLLYMVARALRPSGKDRREAARAAWAATMAPASAALGLRPPALAAAVWPALLADCYPLHPSVLVALPQLLRQIAESERVLLAFLHADEPWGLRDLLAATAPGAATLPIYRLSHLYAYVEHGLGPDLFGRARGQRWAELAAARALLAEDDPLQFQALTVVGTLGALAGAPGLGVDGAQVAFALADAAAGPAAAPVRAALAALEQRGMLRHRQGGAGYLLSASSELDLDTLILARRRALDVRADLAALLQHHADLTPPIAHRHSYRTGATRAFAVRFVAAAQLAATTAPPAGFDGELLHVVATDDQQQVEALRWAADPARAAEPQRIIVLPQWSPALRERLLELAALRALLDDDPALEHDRAARHELALRLLEARQALAQLLAASYGGARGCWFHRGAAQRVGDAQALDVLLSAACDATYPDAPRLWSELLMRRQLSAAAARARRNLATAMLTCADQAQLDLPDRAPALAIYAGLLRQGGLHRPDVAGRWRLGPPPPEDPLGLLPAWRAMERLLEQAGAAPLAVGDLLALLERPPYGVRAGLAPLLLLALYAARAGELGLYERGSHVAMSDRAAYARLLARPAGFALRRKA